MSKIQIKTLKLSSIKADQGQVRKTFNEKSIKELAESIKVHGLIQPITVRPLDNGYQIVAGERRFRACKSLEKKQLECIVKDFSSDHAIREVQIIENLQREKVDAIEEAEAISYLLDTYTAQQIVDRIGRSYTYVRQRISLGGLIPYFKEAVQSEKLSIGKAIQLGVYSAEEQSLMAEHIGDISNVSNIADYIINNLLSERTYSLADAPFDLEDEKLLPKAGACVTCPFNDANMGDLFKKGAPICTRAHCFVTKKKKGLHAIIEGCKKSKQLLIPDVFHWGVDSKETQEVLKVLSDNGFKSHCRYQVEIISVPEKPSLENIIALYDEEEDKEEAERDFANELIEYEKELIEYNQAKEDGYTSGLLLNTSKYYTTEILVNLPADGQMNETSIIAVSKKKMDDCTADEKIIKIKNKEVRKKQIEGGREFEEIVNFVSDSDYLDRSDDISQDEKIAFCISAIQNNLGWQYRDKFKDEKFFSLDCKDENYFEEFKKVYHEGIYNQIIRFFLQTQVEFFENTPKTNKTNNAYYAAVKNYYSDEITTIEDAYTEKENERNAKMVSRIAELKTNFED